MENKVLVIYHKGCLDGIAAAWVASQNVFTGVEFHEGVYGKPVPDVDNKLVYLLDFSYKRDVMLEICKRAAAVVLLDHHKSALEDLLGLPEDCRNLYMSHCTLKNSGCVIAWNYFQSTKIPKLLRHIEDRDLWKFEMEGTKEVCAALYSHDISYKNFGEFVGTSALRRLRKEGEVLIRNHVSNVERVVKTCARTFQLLHYDTIVEVLGANANHMMSSDVGNVLAQLGTSGIGLTYYDTAEERIFSLRSLENGPDVSQIACAYSGGGHVHAAGFSVPREHRLANI